MNEEVFIYVVGTAGSGKSSLTNAFNGWMSRHGFDSITVNLDPGADRIPYSPDVDVREWISMNQIMEEYGLGPNGAQVVCADLIALNAKEVNQRVMEFKSDYALIDTPGQLELFVFRETGKVIIRELNPRRSLIAFIIDPSLAMTPSSFISQLMLSSTTQFRFMIPIVNILSKVDMLDQKRLKEIEEWGKDLNRLYNDVIQESPSMYRQMSEGIFRVIKELESSTAMIPISSETIEGMEDLYAVIQNAFMGGEDLSKD
jgi:hypothetical protein